MSICPKNKSSKGRRNRRRANWKMTAPTLVKCSKCGALMMPHRVCKSCGSYNKKEIVLTGIHIGQWGIEFNQNLINLLKEIEKTDILNIENLKNLDQCGSDLFWFSCFPLKLKDCDGSPVRAVAWF